MKRRYVRYENGVYSLMVRAKCNPPRRRRPVEARFVDLHPNEICHDPNKKPCFNRNGRFVDFVVRPLAHHVRLEDATNEDMPVIIDWIVERGARWSFELIGEQLLVGQGRHGNVRVIPVFSFDDHVVAVECKLTHA